MALVYYSDADFIGRIASNSPQYPYGEFRNKSSAASQDGTPLGLAKLWKSYEGFLQHLLVQGKVSANGLSDTATDSDYADGLYETHRFAGFAAYSPSEPTRKGGTLTNSRFSNSRITNYCGSNKTYNMSVSLYNGGVEHAGTTPGTSTTVRTNEFSMLFTDFGLVEVVSGSGMYVLRYYEQYTLNGIPRLSIDEKSVRVRLTNAAGTRSIIIPMTAVIGSSSGTAFIDGMTGMWTFPSSVGGVIGDYTTATMIVDYDPTGVS